MFKKTFLFLLLTAASLSADNISTKNKMINLLESIRTDFEAGYAPKDWKKEHINWDLDEQFEIAKNQILTTEDITVAEFQQILKGFFLSPRDHHVGIKFFSTESAELPISIRSVAGQVYIVYVDSEKINPGLFPVSAGDELITFDGKPAMEAIIEFQKQAFHSDCEGTDRALAQTFFTNRVASRGHAIPTGPVTIEVKSAGSNTLRSVQLCWEYTPEMITADYSVTREKLPEIASFDFIGCDEPLADYDKQNPFQRGSKYGYLPSLGKKIWQSSPYDFFDAYVYQTKDRALVGYIRLPSYSPFIPELFFESFKEVIVHFQEITDALVIDQTNNPGGSMLYLYAIASLLSDKPLFTPKHKFTINQLHVYEAAEMIPLLSSIKNDQDAIEIFGETVHGYPMSYQFVQFMLDYYRFIQSEWKAKKTITSPHHLYGVDRINPHPEVNYTKPILLLIDELDFSGGDFFPAIMQDNKRAVVMGTKTAGAGGYVRDRVVNNTFGVMLYRYTESVAIRENKDHLENLGVTPDLEYRWTVNDVQDGFYDYADAINEVVNMMVNPPPEGS